jgi:glycosyltransferase involved in cell wall biosynthesis
MALGSWLSLHRLSSSFAFDVIDAHFAYPDGFAATLLGKWFRVPVTITLRGTEVAHARNPQRRRFLRKALARADGIFSVSESLKKLAVELGVYSDNIRVIGNGVDACKFAPVPKTEARRSLGLPDDAPVLVTVGALVERKGFHRVLDVLPALRTRYPDLHYLIVGGSSPEGDRESGLRQQVEHLALDSAVHFLGMMPPEALKFPLSAADVFVLPTSNEGWANVLLEAMACGLPVVTTTVGGNAEVVTSPELGVLVPFGDERALREGLESALSRDWDHQAIVAYARKNSWDDRIETLVQEFTRLVAGETQLGLPAANPRAAKDARPVDN